MSPERWKRVTELFQAAVDRPGAERSPFLAEACAGDAALRREVESLLEAHERAEDFIESPAHRSTSVLDPSLPGLGEPLGPGRHIGVYEIVAFLGAGGMGRVYRARDTRLLRDVAIKVLAPWFAADRERLARFQNEARAVSALSHPNIVTVHDVGEVDGVPFFAMELVEGRTLRELLEDDGAGGRPPLKRVLSLAAQVADGLAAAHARGVVHRDLKPENVMVTRDGRAKVLDFGLAKRFRPGLEPVGSAKGPVTRPGTVLGTVGYMSPEQAGGRPADFRSDQFSFGSILYEMVTGRRAFERPTGVETLAAILRDEPEPIGSAVPGLPPPLGWVVERCLAKDPQDRYESTRDLARDVARLSDSVTPSWGERWLAASVARPRRSWAVAALATLLVGGAMGALWWRPGPDPQPARLRPLTHSGSDASPAVSPDGRLVAFSSRRDGRPRIWLKQIATGAEVALSEGPDDHPRFSPDGTSVLFARSEARGPALYRVAVLGGAPRKLLDDARSGDWSRDGRRLAFVRSARAPGSRPSYLVGVANADGSASRIVERIEAVSVLPPRWSPDGARIAVAHGHGMALAWSILVLDPDGDARRVLQPPVRFGSLSAPAWLDGGAALVYSQADAVGSSPSGALVRQELGNGEARPLLRLLALSGGGLDVAGPGRLVFTLQPGRGSLVEVTLADPLRGLARLTRGSSDDRQPHYTPDGRRVVFSSNRDAQLDLWEVSTGSRAVRRLTDHAAHDRDPRVAPDGRLVWSSQRSGSFEVWMAEADGSQPRQVTRDGVDAENPAMTPDGAWIVYASGNPAKRGLWKVRPDGSQASLLAPGNLALPEVSPDGRLVLFGSFHPPTTTLRVVRLDDGASVPFEVSLASSPGSDLYFIRGRARWRPDGRAIAFVDLDETGRAGVFVQDFVPGRDTAATRQALAGFDPDGVTESFAFSPDGRRLTLSLKERSSDVVLAEGVEGVRP